MTTRLIFYNPFKAQKRNRRLEQFVDGVDFFAPGYDLHLWGLTTIKTPDGERGVWEVTSITRGIIIPPYGKVDEIIFCKRVPQQSGAAAL